MGVLYNEEQKIQLMLLGDLLGSPLAPFERETLRMSLKNSRSSIQEVLEELPTETAEKASALLAKGFKLSLELNKLSQRGVSVVFPEDANIECLGDYFQYEPAFLFAAGELALLEDSEATRSLSLAAFKNTGCNGIFIADRAFDSLLRDEQIAVALRESRALLVSDALNSRATINPRPQNTRDSYGEGVRPSKCVFISGSRSQTLIPKIVQDSLETIISQGIGVLIGDSDKGVDKEIIDFLRVPLYENVTIFTISTYPRVEAETTWQVRTIDADQSLKPQQRQMVKDRIMADEADWGMALFDPIAKNRHGSLQVSSGTLRNAIQMLLQGKMVKFFYLYEGEMLSENLKCLADLEAIIASYRNEHLSDAERNAILSARGVSPADDASAIKAKKVMAKYNSLRKSEENLLAETGESDTPSEPVQETLPLLFT
ncbi:MAG: hypothetical protein ACOYIP_06950 [Coriobacteriales bacterium]|jgi:hypothetical protein